LSVDRIQIKHDFYHKEIREHAEAKSYKGILSTADTIWAQVYLQTEVQVRRQVGPMHGIVKKY